MIILSFKSEELGLVSHLFADKTGTLTQNIMVLKKLYHAMPVTSVPPQSYMQQESIDTLLDASEALQRLSNQEIQNLDLSVIFLIAKVVCALSRDSEFRLIC